MEVIAPYVESFVMPEGSITTVYAANQAETYNPLPSICTPDGRVVSQWRPSQDELRRLYHGEPITLIVHTFGSPLQPLQMVVGGVDLRRQEHTI